MPSDSVSFQSIEKLALFGGSWVLAGLLPEVKKLGLPVQIFTSTRHLSDPVTAHGTSLKSVLEKSEIPYSVVADVNQDASVASFVDAHTLGLALGAAWVFEKSLVEKFQGRFLDFMGIDLPRYRGGAHYTWAILNGNRKGACCLQLIHGGKETFHRGEILKSKTYEFPPSARTPQDYFQTAVPTEVAFLSEFFQQALAGQVFELHRLNENEASYFPFLNTLLHGWVDWSLPGVDLERFVCAFDEPYAGASTFLGGKRVFLKSVTLLETEGPFHPFCRGLIYRKTQGTLFVACKPGALAVHRVVDEAGADCISSIEPGMRFTTPQKILDELLQLNVGYSDQGVEVD